MNKTEAKDFVEKVRKLQIDFRELYLQPLLISIQDDCGIHIKSECFRSLRIALGIKKKDCSIEERGSDLYPYEMTFRYDGLTFFAISEKKAKEY